jgi:ferritin-like metal-binding protein YciE
MSRDRTELVRFLGDMYSVEQQSIAQLIAAPALSGNKHFSNDFRRHYVETEQHLRLVQERLDSHESSVSVIKTLIMKAAGSGLLFFALTQPETPAKLAVNSYSYEAMEWAGYEILARLAKLADDLQTLAVAFTIRNQERTMMERLETSFDAAEEAAHGAIYPEQLRNHLRRHLREAHALEIQSANLIQKAKETANDPLFTEVCNQHFEHSRKHAKMLKERLDFLGAKPRKIEDRAPGFGGWNWNFFSKWHSDRPAKIAGFAYAHEHLKTAGYALLVRTAKRACDTDTEELCLRLMIDQRAMANRVAGTFDSVVQTTLNASGSDR